MKIEEYYAKTWDQLVKDSKTIMAGKNPQIECGAIVAVDSYIRELETQLAFAQRQIKKLETV